VEEEVWFHGFIPREEAEFLLQKDGDFLVRESDTSAELCFILSRFWKYPEHVFLNPEDIKARS
jgi:SHC-transforming protein 1